MRMWRVGLLVGGLACLVVTPWFALSYFPAYASFSETPPPWADWIDWPILISGDVVDVYNTYGLIFGVGLVIVTVSLVVLIRHSTGPNTGTRRSWMLIAGGLGAVAVGSILEYGFGAYIDASLGFFGELLGFLAMIIGTALLGHALRKESQMRLAGSLAIGLSGLVAIVIGVALVGHIPSGPALVPLITAVVFGCTGIPRPLRGTEPASA